MLPGQFYIADLPFWWFPRLLCVRHLSLHSPPAVVLIIPFLSYVVGVHSVLLRLNFACCLVNSELPICCSGGFLDCSTRFALRRIGDYYMGALPDPVLPFDLSHTINFVTMVPMTTNPCEPWDSLCGPGAGTPWNLQSIEASPCPWRRVGQDHLNHCKPSRP